MKAPYCPIKLWKQSSTWTISVNYYCVNSTLKHQSITVRHFSRKHNSCHPYSHPLICLHTIHHHLSIFDVFTQPLFVYTSCEQRLNTVRGDDRVAHLPFVAKITIFEFHFSLPQNRNNNKNNNTLGWAKPGELYCQSLPIFFLPPTNT